MKIYNYNKFTGSYLGDSLADQDPIDANNWLIPAYATTIEPLPQQDGKYVCFSNDAWIYVDVPEPTPAPTPKELTYQEKRIAEYPLLMNYIDGVVKGDQAQIDKYIADCLAVKAKYPK